jgi:hypothetical protein
MKTDVTDFYPYSWIRESKTRLAKTIGNEKPWPSTTTCFFAPWLKLALSNDKFVFTMLALMTMIFLPNVIKKDTIWWDLGQRMHDAFETLLKWGIKTALL